MQTIHARIEGRVQGVFFRDSTRSEAIRLGLNGWVRNTRDGAVEAVFQGDEESLNNIQVWLKKGPPHARVEQVTVDQLDDKIVYDNFEIVY
ncbi:MAG: acylphosphatase [Desulfocapsaceae bacterium]|nr:acylphosphatase [Desulfocapsaceae bacterium]